MVETPETDTPCQTPEDTIEAVVQRYGDLLYDLSNSILWDHGAAQYGFRAILRAIQKMRSRPEEKYVIHERPAILRIAIEELKRVARKHRRPMTSLEQIENDAHVSPTSRLKHFEHYFRRLSVDDQIFLHLKDKYGFPLSEIATAMGIPQGTLKMRRQQALRTLEDWLWENSL